MSVRRNSWHPAVSPKSRASGASVQCVEYSEVEQRLPSTKKIALALLCLPREIAAGQRSRLTGAGMKAPKQTIPRKEAEGRFIARPTVPCVRCSGLLAGSPLTLPCPTAPSSTTCCRPYCLPSTFAVTRSLTAKAASGTYPDQARRPLLLKYPLQTSVFLLYPSSSCWLVNTQLPRTLQHGPMGQLEVSAHRAML